MRRFAVIAALLLLGATTKAEAATKITYGYTDISDTVAVFAAQEQGYFAKSGLDVSFQRVAQTAVVGPALVSGSLQIGVLTAPTFIEAVAGGLDLVAISGLSLYSKDLPDGIFARTGDTIHGAKDFVGKKVAVATMRGVSDILFDKWLEQGDVNTNQVTIVEAPFARMADMLKSGMVDAVLVGRPYLNKIVDEHIGYMVAPVNSLIGGGQIAVLTGTTREWAKENPAAVKAWREAVEEGTRYVGAHPDKAREYIGKYLKLSPELVAQLEIGHLAPKLTQPQLRWWVDLLRDQHLIENDVSAASLIAP